MKPPMSPMTVRTAPRWPLTKTSPPAFTASWAAGLSVKRSARKICAKATCTEEANQPSSWLQRAAALESPRGTDPSAPNRSAM